MLIDGSKMFEFAKKPIEEYDKLSTFKTPFIFINNALEGGIHEQSVIILTGDTGIGKSTLALQFITNFWSTYNYMTYIYSGELHPVVLMKSVYNQLRVDLPKLPNLYGRTQGGIKDIEMDLNAIKPKFILIDNLMCLSCGTGETNQLQNNAINKCREWANKYDAIVLLVAHASKSSNNKTFDGKLTINSICGSSNVANQASLILALNKLNDDTRSLEILKNRVTGKLCEVILKYDVKRKIYGQLQGSI